MKGERTMLALRYSNYKKAVGFILVLAMVLMYSLSFTMNAYADPKTDVRVHFEVNSALYTSSDSVIVQIELNDGTTLGGISFNKTGGHYDVSINSGSLPDSKTLVKSVSVTILSNNVQIVFNESINKESNIGKNGVYNIWIVTTPPPPTPTFDLEVNKTVNGGSSATVSSGAMVTFKITVTNSSITGASNVLVNDILPSGLTINSSSASIGSYNGRVWTIGSLGANVSKVLTVTATADATFGTMTNTAKLSRS